LPERTATTAVNPIKKNNNRIRLDVLTAMMPYSLVQVQHVSDVEGGEFL
jgi:hypothetical protein